MNEDNEQTRVLSPDKEKLYLLAASQPLRDVATLMLEIRMRPEEEGLPPSLDISDSQNNPA